MDFDFTDDQNALREAVGRWVEKGFAFERRHALAKAGGATRQVYGELAELGLCGLCIDADHGGMGFGPIEAMVVMEELGRGLVNAPVAAGALVAPALMARAPQALQQAWLPRMADGSALVVLAHQERGLRYQLGATSTTAVLHGQTWTLSGHKQVVPAGDEADAFIVPARLAGAGAPESTPGTASADAPIQLFLVDKASSGLSVRGYPTQDGARAADLSLQDTPAQWLAADGTALLELAGDIGIAAVAAEAVGLMDKLVALTVDYLNTRKQFNVPLSSFQALRHRVADLKMQLELARSMSYYAALKLGEEPAVRRRALSQAKVQINQSARFIGQQSVQMHGGIGVTDDYAASHYFKRLTMIEMAWGDTSHHLAEVSARMQDTAGVFA